MKKIVTFLLLIVCFSQHVIAQTQSKNVQLLNSSGNAITIGAPGSVTNNTILFPGTLGTTGGLFYLSGVAASVGTMSWLNPTTNGFVLTLSSGLPVWSDPTAISWALNGNATASAFNGTTGNYLGTSSLFPLVLATTNATAQPIEFFTGGAERMRISSTGSIGVGATSPNVALDVAKDIATRETNNTTVFTTAGSPYLDYAFDGGTNQFSMLRLSGAATGAFTFNGIHGGFNGKILTIYNATGQTMTLANQTGAVAASQITTGTGANIAIPTGGCANLIYSGTESRWIVRATSNGNGSSGTNTGDVTLAGQNYLSLTGQQITANPVNLAGTNITSTLGVGNGGTGTNIAFTPGSVVFAGTSGIYTQNNSNLFWDNTNLGLIVGGGSLLSGAKLQASGSANSTIQANIQNTNAGTSASSDWIATADNGSDVANYIDMGINSSVYSDAGYTIGGALAGYVYSNGGVLTLGTQTAAKDVIFHMGGTLTANEVGRFLGSTAGAFRLGLPGTTTGSLQLGNATGANVISVQAPASTTAYTFTLPSSGGTNGYLLQTNGSGTTSWVPASSSGVQYNVPTASAPQNTAITTGGNYLFNVAYGTTNAAAAAGAVINSTTTFTNSNATGLTVTSVGTGTATSTGLSVSATGGTNNYAAIFTSGSVGIGTSTPKVSLDIVKDYATEEYANSTNFAASTNDVAFDGGTNQFGLVRLGGSPAADFTITSIAGGVNGKRIMIYNKTGKNFTLSNQSASGTAANRIITGSGSDVIIPSSGAVELVYSNTDSRWVVRATSYSSTTGSSLQATPADPTGVTATLASGWIGPGKMMGLGTSGGGNIVFTPTKSGKILIVVSATENNNGAGDGGEMQIRYGTGTAPANGAALTGTAVGALVIGAPSDPNGANAAGHHETIPMTSVASVTGLTIGTPIWIDLALYALDVATNAGTSTLQGISVSVIEL